jgi:predicted anti-sigma-YlaC factor YlaD
LGPEDVQCTAFRAAISDWLDGFCPAEQQRSFDDHVAHCTACRREADLARRTLALIQEWQPPEPPAQFADRVMERIAADVRDPDSVDCETVTLLLDPLLEDELAPARREALGAHTRRCPRCAEQLRTGAGLNRLLPLWTVPDPEPGMTDRIMARIARSRTSTRFQVGLRLAAAAVLAVASVWFLVDRPRSKAPGPSAPAAPVTKVDLTPPRGSLWPVGIGGLSGDPLDLQSRPLGETFRRALQSESDFLRR